MANIQVRLPDAEVEALDALAARLKVSRSDAARSSLHEGIRALQLEHAWRRYAAGEWSLERAAQEAAVGLHRMAEFADARGTPFFRQSAAELEREIRAAAETVGKRARRNAKGAT